MRSWKSPVVNQHAKESFSQCGEDLIVKFIFDNLGCTRPSYVDIGAHHPTYINNTALFYKLGSRGVNIEPDPELFKLFPAQRPEDTNLNIGVSNKDGFAEFYVMSTPTLNTFSAEDVKKYKKEGYSISKVIEVETKNINAVLETLDHAPDFLNLDAEGIDFEILQSLDYKKFSPKVICVETISFSTKGLGAKDHAMIKFLSEKGYLLYADTYINSIFVQEHLWRRK